MVRWGGDVVDQAGHRAIKTTVLFPHSVKRLGMVVHSAWVDDPAAAVAALAAYRSYAVAAASCPEGLVAGQAAAHAGMAVAVGLAGAFLVVVAALHHHPRQRLALVAVAMPCWACGRAASWTAADQASLQAGGAGMDGSEIAGVVGDQTAAATSEDAVHPGVMGAYFRVASRGAGAGHQAARAYLAESGQKN